MQQQYQTMKVGKQKQPTQGANGSSKNGDSNRVMSNIMPFNRNSQPSFNSGTLRSISASQNLEGTQNQM